MRTNEEMRIDGPDWLILILRPETEIAYVLTLSDENGSCSADMEQVVANQIAEFLINAGQQREED